MDAVKSLGEDCSARIVAGYLNTIGHKASYCNPKLAGLLLTVSFGHAQVLPDSYERLSALRETDEICIFPGFYGYSTDGEVITFSRGGSDITGSILSAAVHADIYENWTDVSGLLAADPHIVESPKTVKYVSYRELRTLSYMGASVLHTDAVLPVSDMGIPINIRNTDRPGTPAPPSCAGCPRARPSIRSSVWPAGRACPSSRWKRSWSAMNRASPP